MKLICVLVLKLEVTKGTKEVSQLIIHKRCTLHRYWLTGFTPVYKPGSIHHIIVAGCNKRPPRTKHNVWNCGVNGNPVLEPTYPSFVVSRDQYKLRDNKDKVCRLALMVMCLLIHCIFGQIWDHHLFYQIILDFLLEGRLSISILSYRFIISMLMCLM